MPYGNLPRVPSLSEARPLKREESKHADSATDAVILGLASAASSDWKHNKVTALHTWIWDLSVSNNSLSFPSLNPKCVHWVYHLFVSAWFLGNVLTSATWSVDCLLLSSIPWFINSHENDIWGRFPLLPTVQESDVILVYMSALLFSIMFRCLSPRTWKATEQGEGREEGKQGDWEGGKKKDRRHVGR